MSIQSKVEMGQTLENVVKTLAADRAYPELFRAAFGRDSEKADLIAFLRTLTDKKFITDPKFSDPFQ